MNKKGKVYIKNLLAGVIEETQDGEFVFSYEKTYIQANKPPVSLTLPIQEIPYQSDKLFPFFDGLIPEGWLLDKVTENWKINRNDRMALLLATCRDCIGAVSIEPE